MDRLFAYGTLLAPELREKIVGRALRGNPATLSGYACFRVRRAAYPAIVPDAGRSTRGEVIGALNRDDWDRLDRYESSLYRRVLVAVRGDDGAHIAAYTYVIEPASVHRLSDEPWEYEWFRRRHLRRYLGRE